MAHRLTLRRLSGLDLKKNRIRRLGELFLGLTKLPVLPIFAEAFCELVDVPTLDGIKTALVLAQSCPPRNTQSSSKTA